MLLSSVIIILREVLEAAILFSILIGLSKRSGFGTLWVAWTLAFGTIGAFVYAMNIGMVSDWFNGVGQEVMNALMQLAMYFMLVFYVAALVHSNYQQRVVQQKSDVILVITMVIITSLAITREGSEILLYFFSVAQNENYNISVTIGMLIGISIGLSIGFLFYYFLMNLKYKWAINIGLTLLILSASGLVSQASMLLIQADWLPAQLPLWDSSVWLSERSIMGQFLYVFLGYEATPTAVQASFYLASLLFPVFVILVVIKKQGLNSTSPL